MIRNRAIVTGPAFISLGLMGAFFACWGTTLPAMRGFLDLSIERAAQLTAWGQASHAVTCFLGGVLSDLMRRDRVLMAGCFFLGSGVFFIGGLDSYFANVMLVLWMGIGSGLILSSSNALLVGLYPEKKGPVMNLHHGTFGIFSLVSPLVMGCLLSQQNRWPLGYDGLGVILMAVGVFFAFTATESVPSLGLARFFGDLGRVAGNAGFSHLMLMGFLAVGTQFALMFLSVTFLTEAKQLDIFQASLVLSFFFVGLFIGRFSCAWIAVRILNSRIILLLLVLQTLSLFVAWQSEGWTSALALVASGFACSGIFPCLLALTGSLFYGVAGTALGLLASMNSLGGVFIVWMSGMLSERDGIGFGFLAMVLSSAAGLVLFLLRYKALVRQERTFKKAAAGKSRVSP
jgi:fucose permease